MKKTLFISLITLSTAICADDCQQECSNRFGEKCYDTDAEYSPGDSDGEEGCGDKLQECMENCEKAAALKKKQAPTPTN